MKRGWAMVGGLSLFCLATVAQAEPTADQVLTDAGLSAGDKQNVTNGQFVNVSVSGVSERDLSFAIAFLVKTPPEILAKQITDQVTGFGGAMKRGIGSQVMAS